MAVYFNSIFNTNGWTKVPNAQLCEGTYDENIIDCSVKGLHAHMETRQNMYQESLLI